jgi:alpha-L-fucosidase
MARNKAIQPAICSLTDGRILMLCRTNQGTIWKSISYNNGYSWSICEPSKQLNPDSALDLTHINDTLFLISNLSSQDRHALTLSASYDQGETWKVHSVIAEGPGEYSYPCMIKDSNNSLHITYTENRYSIKHTEISYKRLGL